jgi:GT2 family glycosyltransferase
MHYDVVISTLNRPESLRNCIEMIETQTEKPSRVIIVDASDEHDGVKAYVMKSRDTAIEWVFMKSDAKSLPHQRNLGLTRVQSPVVLLPDDDSMLHPWAAAKMMSAYQLDDRGQIGGVSGMAASVSPLGRGSSQMKWTRALKDGIQPLRNRLEDRFATKPFNSYPRELWRQRAIPGWVDGKRFILVETIGGYLLSLRADVAKKLKFDEVLGYGIGYALHEDMEMSLRLQKSGYLLVAAHDASIFHNVHPSKRAGGFNYGFCWIANYIYACRKNLPEGSVSWRDDLTHYLRYKLLLYKIRSIALRDDYSRDISLGAKAAWNVRSDLMSSSVADLEQMYRELCDAHIRR